MCSHQVNAPGTFGDTTMHLQDTSAAIRTTRVRATTAQPGDSVRIRGTTGTRAGGFSKQRLPITERRE